MVKLYEGYFIFRTIRNCPFYFEARKKEVMAMVTNLKCLHYFSLSAGDTNWTSLRKCLGKLVDRKDMTEYIESNMDWLENTDLLPHILLHATKYLHHRVQNMIWVKGAPKVDKISYKDIC